MLRTALRHPAAPLVPPPFRRHGIIPMNSDDDVFADALALPAAERSAFLDTACAQDPAQRARIGSLLAGYDQAEALKEQVGGGPGRGA